MNWFLIILFTLKKNRWKKGNLLLCQLGPTEGSTCQICPRKHQCQTLHPYILCFWQFGFCLFWSCAWRPTRLDFSMSLADSLHSDCEFWVKLRKQSFLFSLLAKIAAFRKWKMFFLKLTMKGKKKLVQLLAQSH